MIWLTCNDCGESSEIFCNGDDPLFCPSCRGIDCFTDFEEEEEDGKLEQNCR